MSGVSVDTAPRPATDETLTLIAQGGPAFLERLQQFNDARDAAQRKLDDLGIGADIAATRAQAEADRESARQTVRDAGAEADSIRAAARVQAGEIVHNAMVKAAETLTAHRARVDTELAALRALISG